MAPPTSGSRRTPTGRPRGRPPGTTNAARAARLAALAASEPPPKRRRYVPGGLGGGGRFVDATDIDANATEASSLGRSRTRDTFNHTKNNNEASPSLLPKRARSTRTRAATADHEIEFGSAAAMAASVKQVDDYKPREERGWEEFHPNLDIDRCVLVLRAEEVDGLLESSSTPVVHAPGTPLNGSMTPSKQPNPSSTGNTPNPPPTSEQTAAADGPNGTPSRRSRRPTRDVVSVYSSRPLDFSMAVTPKTPKVLPIQNQTAKERLDLKLPSYRKTNRVELFESKTFGQARYVDKAMSNVGYQESDHFIRPERQLIKATETTIDEDIDPSLMKPEDNVQHGRLGRVEYDMDEQDDMWLEQHNAQRKTNDLEAITREIFEIAMTKIDKEWHALEKRIPKPNPKPPQTHRPRSSSAVAVSGEPQAGDEPDSKCAICDDGDCENTNAIVFCDGCNLAVHQECYGVPFIPEGQWLCRKCQLCGRGVPTCIFCPNTDGAFKQTNSSKWAHLLCAMWIPEVCLGNHTFMEPVMDVEKVPRTRWKLNCYICHQKMGACIQCSNKNCYQAFHVTCARRARLYLKMKTSSGTLAVLDGGVVLKAFCDRHCPAEYTEEQKAREATKAAKKFYKRTMRGRIWADNHAVANVIAAQYRNTLPDQSSDEALLTGQKESGIPNDKKKGQPAKNVWRLPSGAPVIPQAVFEVVDASLQRFAVRKRKEFLGEACRYWTLKREARRGAALLKRLQLQMDSFSSMELTRRNFATMGPDGKERLARRIEFAQTLLNDLEQLKTLSENMVEREQLKLDAAELEQDFVDECYFPIAKHLLPAIEKAISLDKDLFIDGFKTLQQKVEERYYVKILAFAQDIGDIILESIVKPHETRVSPDQQLDAPDASPTKNAFADIRERRKLGKRILKAIQPQLETALKIECEISNVSYETLQAELETRIETSLGYQQAPIVVQSQYDLPEEEEGEEEEDEEDGEEEGPEQEEQEEQDEDDEDEGEDEDEDDGKEDEDDSHDTIMVDATPSEITVKARASVEVHDTDAEAMDITVHVGGIDGGSIDVNTSGLDLTNGDIEASEEPSSKITLVIDAQSETPPGSTAFVRTTNGRHNGPPTPPQSNGSLGKEADPLAEGGVLWYLKEYQPRGTSIVGDLWAAGRDAVRMLSEDLTDLDDEELKGLGADVNGATSMVVDTETEETTVTYLSVSKSRAAASPRKRRTSTRRR